jgi:predicted ATPase
MLFKVLAQPTQIPAQPAALQGVAQAAAYLIADSWDDWLKFNTLYTLVIFDDQGVKHEVGGVKIGQFGMTDTQKRPDVPLEFTALSQELFSLGQDDSYYGTLNSLGPELRDDVLKSLRDMALDLDLFARALPEKVTGYSLLRSVTRASVRGQFYRLARGGSRLSRYHFSYTAPESAGPLSLTFKVEPESNPPTNVHVLIGRNGVGKTTFLNRIARAVVEVGPSTEAVGMVSLLSDAQESTPFANLVSVTFSAFDPFVPPRPQQDRSIGVQYFYIGLKSEASISGSTWQTKDLKELTEDFAQSVLICRQSGRLVRWRRALEVLESDPLFADAQVAQLAKRADAEVIQQAARQLFEPMSSGHKVVLLTITRLVETVEERTLVLFDEPEAHLHPPLLAAFTRALSDLLIDRNGVAIVATHSPVVLQEVPRSCAWKIRRHGATVVAERPEIETFGENVGVLTREVFGLEVIHAGFHRLLQDNVDRDSSYEQVVKRFDGQLGGEARAILRGTIAERDSQDDDEAGA